MHAFINRPLTGEWPYLWLDATYLKQREGGRIVDVAAIIAVADDRGRDHVNVDRPNSTARRMTSNHLSYTAISTTLTEVTILCATKLVV